MRKFKEALQIGDKEFVYYICGYSFMVFIAIFLGTTLADKVDKEIIVKQLNLLDVIYIFTINLIVILSWLVISPLGLSILNIFSFFLNFGKVGLESGIPPIIYYLVSLFHGFGEILVNFILFSFTLKQIYLIFKFLKCKDFRKIRSFYESSISYVLSRIVIILFISAIFEVVISNFLINLLYK